MLMTCLPKPNQLLLLPKLDQTATVITLNITALYLLFTKVNGEGLSLLPACKTGVWSIFSMQFEKCRLMRANVTECSVGCVPSLNTKTIQGLEFERSELTTPL